MSVVLHFSLSQLHLAFLGWGDVLLTLLSLRENGDYCNHECNQLKWLNCWQVTY